MECLAQEPVLFEDVLCQLHDMIQPEREGSFTLRDLKRARSVAGTLFNILFNLNKFIAFETRDPFVIRQVNRGFCSYIAQAVGYRRLPCCTADFCSSAPNLHMHHYCRLRPCCPICRSARTLA